MLKEKAGLLDKNGKINRNDPSVWEWKSEMMEQFIKKVAEVVHKHGKELYVDVPVSWKDYSRNAKESGLDYRRILRHADKIIIWNYFYLEDDRQQSLRVLQNIWQTTSQAVPTISLSAYGAKRSMLMQSPLQRQSTAH